MPKATHRVTGRTVSADEAVLRRLGAEWQVVAEPEPPVRKAAPRKRAAKKSDSQ